MPLETLVAPPSPATEKRKLRIFVVDDHPLYRAGLRNLINETEDLVVGGEADSASRAVSLLRTQAADAVIVDISLQGADGLELLKSIRAEHQTLPVLILSMHDEGVYAMRALRAGANGYLMKREEPEVIAAGLRTILAGEIAVSPQFKEQLIFRVLRGGQGTDANPVDNLSDRELEVLNLVGRGLGTRQIAEKLHLSTKTVESHRLHIKEKLHLQHASEMVRFATEWVNRHLAAS